MLKEVKSGQVKSGQVKSGQVKSEHVNSGQAKSGEVKSAQVKSGLFQLRNVKTGQVKLEMHLRLKFDSRVGPTCNLFLLFFTLKYYNFVCNLFPFRLDTFIKQLFNIFPVLDSMMIKYNSLFMSEGR